jgi:alginate O-acetyltransferase complex protein AlgI
MLFHSATFAAFITVVFGLYVLLRGSGARKWLLLAASYLFYAHWDWRYVSLLALSTGVDFVAGHRIHAAAGLRGRRGWLLVSLGTNLGLLAFFKYGNFLLANLAPAFAALGVERPELPGEIPVGISFYTFQTLSYSIDVYLGRTTPCRSLRDFALYVAFFAQLVAGPIVRSTEFLPQVREMRAPRAAEVSAGAQRFVLGLFKKVVLADNAAVFVDAVFADPAAQPAPLLWAGMYAFALQIYLDFSAYTDMALGIGRAFHLRFPENFERPYMSRSISEFWRRWHMSLSFWLRDYLYVPLGGSRHGAARTYLALMATMLLGGLWHGASWAFVIWGGYHGLLLALERRVPWLRTTPDQRVGGVAGLVRTAVTFHLVCFGWVIFRGVDAGRIADYFRGMATAWRWPTEGADVALLWAVATLVIVLAQHVVHVRSWRTAVWDRSPALFQGAVLALLVLLVSTFQVGENAFLYFQF